MTMISQRYVKCTICGGFAKQLVLTSTNCFGGTSDLDFRPPQMMRNTMDLWVQQCPHCAYTSDNLDDPTGVSREFIESQAYQGCEGNTFASELATQFYRCYMIKKADGKTMEAFYAALHGAWACDDAGDVEMAVLCRQKALELFDLLDSPNRREDDYLVKMDLLRRTGQFEAVEALYAERTFSGEENQKIAAFQVELARRKDTKCYRIGKALGMNEWD